MVVCVCPVSVHIAKLESVPITYFVRLVILRVDNSRQTMTVAPDTLSISRWLADLRMECYKKQLEDFDTIKVRDFIELARDRLIWRMLDSRRELL